MVFLKGTNVAAAVVKAVTDELVGTSRVLSLNTGGSVTIVNNSVENVLGCD